MESSYLQNQVTETTGVSAGLNQRLLGKVFLNLSGAYQFVKYVSSSNISGSSSRNDDISSLNASLSRAFLKRGTFSVFYQISRDDSSQQGYSFTSHQVGFQVGFTY